MATVDPYDDISIVQGHDGMVARIPLSEPPGPWIKEFLPLARAREIPAEAREEPGKVLLVVTVPPAASKEETFQRLDAALDLVDKAKVAAIDGTRVSGTAEQHIQGWWSRQRADAAL